MPTGKPLRVLVAAKELRLDRTSEGICSSKFVVLLARAGHQVTCLTSDRFDERGGRIEAPWLGGVELQHIGETTGGGAWTKAANAGDAMARFGRAGAFLDQKTDAACAYATGYSTRVWREVEAWQSALVRAFDRRRLDVVITRGAGRGFEPHMAMLRLGRSLPWVANYHDPFPVSLYPEPYRRTFPMLSRFQESIHRHIVAAADALTFPSRRLLEWVLQRPLAAAQRKAFVVAHVAMGLEHGPLAPVPEMGDIPPGAFTLIHTGTVIRERNPHGLLRGFLEFVDAHGLTGDRARLVFIGRVDADQERHAEWGLLRDRGVLVRIDRRLTYAEALDCARHASACVVLEADGRSSPFFAAKLADYVWLRKPILALSPFLSVSTDLLGGDYPLRVLPHDAPAIRKALDRLWTHHQAGTLVDLLPGAALREQLGWPAVSRAAEAAFAHAVASHASVLDRDREVRHA